MKEEENQEQAIPIDVIGSLLSSQADAIIEKPVSFDVQLEDISMIPNGKVIDKIIIKPLKVHALAQMVPLLLKLNSDEINALSVNNKIGFNPDSIKVFQKYQDLVIDIIVIGIYNKPNDAPDWFKEMLIANFTWEDLHTFLNAILFRMGSQSFQNSIILSSKMSPITSMGIIAMQKNLKNHLIYTQS